MKPQQLTDRISQREEWVVASLLDNLDKPWGPNLCTALAHTDYWVNPVARNVAAMLKGLTNRTRANLAAHLGSKDSKWLDNPAFLNGLPLDLSEHEAFDLCAYYRSKRLERLIGDALNKLKEHPEQAKCVAESLQTALDQFV